MATTHPTEVKRARSKSVDAVKFPWLTLETPLLQPPPYNGQNSIPQQ